MGRSLATLLRDADTETLKRSDICQPAVTLVNMAAWACLQQRGVVAAGFAGFSLGEYAALASAGVISTEDCFKLVKARGEAMEADCQRLAGESGGVPGMAAVIGLAPEKIEADLAAWNIADLYAANYNSPKQTVVAGTAAALAQAKERFLAAGARRFLPLAVAGPFHSPFMRSAQAAFSPILEQTAFADPRLPVYSNVSGKQVASGAEAKSLALKHIISPLRWTDETRAINAANGFDLAVEAGPGKTLRGLWRDNNCAAPCKVAGTMESIEEV
jgi:[acyl-carrier-protein] S-malonyltransferase